MTIDVKVNLGDGAMKLDDAVQFGIFITSEQALKDCNYYCKQDSSTLIDSSLIHSTPETGELRWVTPYAEYQYTYPGTRLEKNPNACPEWALRAAENNRETWQKMFAKAVKMRAG